ncbi:ATP-binding protein [Candidatus Woesearchaeota archaeon]|nr:ATP-binding protein [Candidatus Woesearchaeota archaeon]
MDVTEQIRRFTEFIDSFCKEQILARIKKDEKFLNLDFVELIRFEPELADIILEQPEEAIKAAETAVGHFDTLGDVSKFKARFCNVSLSHKVVIRNIRSKMLDKFLLLEGVVRQKSDVRPQVILAKFECPGCGNILSVLQLESKFREPTRCGCGRKGKFRPIDKEMVDAQGIVLEESADDLEGGEQPKRINLLLKNDLVSPMSEKKTNPGSRIRVGGILKEVPILAKDGGKLTRFDVMIDVNYVESIDEDFSSIEISDHESNEILKISRDPHLREKLINSVVPSIYGHERIKEAVLLLMAGGVRKTRDDGSVTRGDIHILLIGDPGAGKCVAGNTKIMLQNGEIVRIDDFSERAGIIEESKKIEATLLPTLFYNGKMNTGKAVRVWKRQCNEKLIKIITRSGKELNVTQDHPLFTVDSGFIISKKARDFSIGERIAAPRMIEISGEIQILSGFVYKKYSNNLKKLSYPVVLDKKLARFLGYLCGDGYISYSKTSGYASITNNDTYVLKDFSTLLQLLFRAEARFRQPNKSKSCCEVASYGKSLVDFVKFYFVSLVNLAAKKDIPEKVLRSPDDVLAEFIKGLFECDSHVNIKKRQIEFSSISKSLAENLQMCLLRFGVVSFFKTKEKYATNSKDKRKVKSYEIVIGGIFASDYVKKIGYISEKKRKQGEILLEKITYFNTNVDLIPNINSLLKCIRREHALYQRGMGVSRSCFAHLDHGDRLPSVETARKIVRHLKLNGYKSTLISLLEEIANAEIFWDEITSIIETPDESNYVYDLEVEGTHNYVANGIVIHNSQILKRVSKIAPKGRFVSGKGVSGAGLTASVVKDEFLSGWSLEAGALVLGNKGVVCVDELDKMNSEDRDAMHEALEGQQVTIAKANIQATLRAETTMLAAANPKFGRFDPYEVIPKQIDLPSTLINRFDLIFPVRDLPSGDKDEKLASFVLNLHQSPNMVSPDIDSVLLRKYFVYARQKIRPDLSDGAVDEIKKYYLKMRSSSSGDNEIKAIPISARQLEALIRMSEANAKLRLDTKVTREDSKKAIDLMHYCLSQVGLDPETGQIDIDRISTGITASERGKISLIKELITELEGRLGKTIPLEKLSEAAKEKGISEEDVNDIVEKLKRAGDIFSPRPDIISKL